MNAQDPPRKKTASGGLRFLIVDDDAYYADQFKQRIFNACAQQSGVHVVSTVGDALTKLDECNFDVCFLDFGLADRIGLRTDKIARLRKLLTAMIFVSEKPNKEAAMRALNIGAKDFLIKSNVSDFDIAKSISYALYWKYCEIELEAEVVRDKITGLGTVPLFDEHFQHALQLAKRGKEKVGLLMIGLNGMEPVQEDYGDQVSGALLKQVAERIAGAVRSTDIVARLNDNQFGTILSKVASPAVVKTISSTVTGVISNKPYNINGYALKIGATVGTSTYPDDGETLKELKVRADHVLAGKKMKQQQRMPFRPLNYY